MITLSNNFIENYIQRVTELSQSPQRIPSATELEKMAADLGLSPEEIEEAQKQSQDHLTRAQGYMRLKHWDDAIEELIEAVALCPSNSDLFLSLAAAHLGRWYQRHRRDDVENVRLRVRECLSIQPDSEEALNLLAKLDRALRWRRTLLVSLGIGLGSFLTTSSLIWLWPESLTDSWAVFWHQESQLEQLEQRLLGEIQALRQEQEQLRNEVLSRQTREKQSYHNALAQLHEHLKRLEEAQAAWQYQLQNRYSTGRRAERMQRQKVVSGKESRDRTY
jgi:tetratricopeptide (TPR) repeat protein